MTLMTHEGVIIELHGVIELHGGIALKSLWVDAVMRSLLYSEHDIGNSQRVLGTEADGLYSILCIQLGTSRGTGSFDGSPFSLYFVWNLPPLSSLLFL